MDFNSFPAQWEWVALIISIVAFIMAVQPFLQMIYGKPQIVTYMPEPRKMDGSAILECHVANRPIVKGILSTLGITRNTARGLIALFEIVEKRTGNKVYEELAHLYSQAGDATQRVDLPAGYMPARFPIVTINETKGIVYPGLVELAKRENAQVLATGLYTISVKVEVEGKVVCDVKKDLMIQPTPPYAYWVSD